MLKELAEYIVGLAPINQRQIDGLQYTDRPLNLIKPPTPNWLEVESLTSVVEALTLPFDGVKSDKSFIHIAGFDCVEVISKDSDVYGKCRVFVRAKLPAYPVFPFGTYMDPEQFVIAAQALLATHPEDDRDYVVRLASNITSANSAQSSDDGISQSVAVKRNLTLSGVEVLKARVKLHPFRTFRDCRAQPGQEFVFRAKAAKEGALPQLALHEADGGAWKLEAVELVREQLTQLLKAAAMDYAVIG